MTTTDVKQKYAQYHYNIIKYDYAKLSKCNIE